MPGPDEDLAVTPHGARLPRPWPARDAGEHPRTVACVVVRPGNRALNPVASDGERPTPGEVLGLALGTGYVRAQEEARMEQSRR